METLLETFSHNLPWIETLNVEQELEKGISPNDDLQREMALYLSI